MPRKLPAPQPLPPIVVSLPTRTDELTVWQAGLTQFGEENCACLVWVKAVYLPTARLTVCGLLALDTTSNR